MVSVSQREHESVRRLCGTGSAFGRLQGETTCRGIIIPNILISIGPCVVARSSNSVQLCQMTERSAAQALVVNGHHVIIPYSRALIPLTPSTWKLCVHMIKMKMRCVISIRRSTFRKQLAQDTLIYLVLSATYPALRE
jgi:hypothetical protein